MRGTATRRRCWYLVLLGATGSAITPPGRAAADWLARTLDAAGLVRHVPAARGQARSNNRAGATRSAREARQRRQVRAP